MENKVKFGDYEFTIKNYSYAVINAFAPALKKLKTLEKAYTKDIETAEYDKYVQRVDELRVAISQIKDDEAKKEYREGLKKKLDDALIGLVKFKPVIEEINYCKNLAMAEWMTDIDIMRPAIEKILEGDKTKIIWESEQAGELIQDCCEFFFQVFNKTKPE